MLCRTCDTPRLVGNDNLKILRRMATNDVAQQRQRWSRVQKLIEKYQQRKGLFPVLFTGSLDDLAVIMNAEDRSNSFLNRSAFQRSLYNELEERQRNGSNLTWRERNLDTFSSSELDAWVRIFQEYWLNMIEALQTLEQKQNEEVSPPVEREEVRDEEEDNSSSDSGTSSPMTPRTFRSRSAGNTRAYLPLRFEVCASIFEADAADKRFTTELADRVRQRISFENRYLSHRILERSPNAATVESRDVVG